MGEERRFLRFDTQVMKLNINDQGKLRVAVSVVVRVKKATRTATTRPSCLPRSVYDPSCHRLCVCGGRKLRPSRLPGGDITQCSPSVGKP